MNKSGLLLCAKYAASPNFFGYCGPNLNRSLTDHIVEKIADQELEVILSDFETLFPYLNLIAKKNNINDPFDVRVVEAYWIGNSFLKPVTPLEYAAFAKEKLLLDKKIDLENFGRLKFKIRQQQFFPHHNFHVFNIFRRTGKDFSFQTVSTMDSCRISFGKIIGLEYEKEKIKSLKVETKPLIVINNQLTLDKPKIKLIKIDYYGKPLLTHFQKGDWISFHWDFLCDKLTLNQVKNLDYYTKKAIDFYNL
jgi:hypothetical protein